MPAAYHSTKTMRQNLSTAVARTETALKRAEENLSPNASDIRFALAILMDALRSEEAVTYVASAPEAPATPEATPETPAETTEADAIAAQAAALAAEVDARLAEQAA